MHAFGTYPKCVHWKRVSRPERLKILPVLCKRIDSGIGLKQVIERVATDAETVTDVLTFEDLMQLSQNQEAS